MAIRHSMENVHINDTEIWIRLLAMAQQNMHPPPDPPNPTEGLSLYQDGALVYGIPSTVSDIL